MFERQREFEQGVATELSDLRPEGMIYYDLRKVSELIRLPVEKQRGPP